MLYINVSYFQSLLYCFKFVLFYIYLFFKMFIISRLLLGSSPLYIKTNLRNEHYVLLLLSMFCGNAVVNAHQFKDVPHNNKFDKNKDCKLISPKYGNEWKPMAAWKKTLNNLLDIWICVYQVCNGLWWKQRLLRNYIHDDYAVNTIPHKHGVQSDGGCLMGLTLTRER